MRQSRLVVISLTEHRRQAIVGLSGMMCMGARREITQSRSSAPGWMSNRDEPVEGDVRKEEDSSVDGRKSMAKIAGYASLDMAHHWAWITIFSILGTLTRLGLQSLNDYTGHLIPPLVWAQFVGCAVMGFVTEDAYLFPKKGTKYTALYVGLTVGYCGSVTSFSAWILQVYQDLANTENHAHRRGYNVISVFTQIMVTLASAIGGFKLATHLALFSNAVLRPPRMRKIENIYAISAIILLGLAFQVASIIAAGVRRDWRGIASFAMVFSPLGALTRWYLARYLNAKNPSFPIGTFAANMIGSFFESVFHLLQYRVADGNACSILQGLQDGYCGALTTVSTFVVELTTLQRDHAWQYATISIALGSVLYVLVDGIDYWVHGSADGYQPRCSY